MTLDMGRVMGHVADSFGRDVVEAHPVVWAEAQGVELWSKQREVLSALQEHRQVSVPAGHGVGKSMLAAVATAWLGSTAPLGDAKIVTTAPTGAQLNNVWGPLRVLHKRLGLPGRITGGQVPEWKIDDLVVAFGRSTRDTTDHTITGAHAPRLLIIIDEADGISEDVWEQLLSGTTGAANRVLALGNPKRPNGPWKKKVDGGGWKLLPISVLDSPNFTSEVVSDELAAALSGREWIEDRRRDYGEGTGLWASRVLGLWPTDAERQIISGQVVEAATREQDDRPGDVHIAGDDHPLYAVDVARMGDDAGVIGRIQDREFRIVDVTRKMTLDVFGDRCRRLLEDDPRAKMVIDAGGLGAGVADVLVRDFGGRVIRFNGSNTARRSDRFANTRAEGWWSAREALERQLVRLSPTDVHHETLATELVTPAYLEDKNGRILVESKDTIRRTLGRSPDFADTLMMACHVLEQVRRSQGWTPIVKTRAGGRRRPRPGSQLAVMGEPYKLAWRGRMM